MKVTKKPEAFSATIELTDAERQCLLEILRDWTLSRRRSTSAVAGVMAHDLLQSLMLGDDD